MDQPSSTGSYMLVVFKKILSGTLHFTLSSLYNMQYLRMAPEEQVQRRLTDIFVAVFLEHIQLCQGPKHFHAM